MQQIEFKIGDLPSTEKIIELYDNSGINRPTSDPGRIEMMYLNSNLVITAWDGDLLIGISRSLTDFCYACYLSDLAVSKEYQKHGIGKKLIEITQREIGEETALILLSAPTAMDYYPKVGFDQITNGFIIKRKK
ncbi:N-acetyltransferase [Echinicola pacifica]|uniref:N-acetyltransferase n=1 Tax=Echinicola pacifica TaxID=346377 RepID=A0A918Q778_9BACT|nr:GNAT family N-acetyltransferase [Echinicola pacifica]GGZ34692.1 N-acetyltransferase [Echinicola pacifica]